MELFHVKVFFLSFNNGTAIIEFNNETGKRCLTIYKSSVKTSPKKKPLPKLAGDWLYEGSVLRRTNKQKPDFNDIINIKPTTVKITQKDRFIILEIPL